MQQDVPATGDSHQVEEAKSVPAQGGTDRDDAFWLSHDERRRNQGMSVRQYCHVNALPLSTYRYRLAKHRRATGDATADAAPPKTGTAFIAIGEPPRGPNASDIEITLAAGLTLRLSGASAERVLERVLERLA